MTNIDVLKLGKLVRIFCVRAFTVVEVIWKDEKYVKEPDRFFYTIFMKVIVILDSIHIQLYNLDNKPHYSLTASLALRTCMLDLLNLYYVLDMLEDEHEMMSRINEIMADHLKYVYVQSKADEQMQIRRDWPNLFEADGTLKKYKHVTPAQMVQGVSNFQSLKTETAAVRRLYSIFSKYEHNGAFTFDLLQKPYSGKGSELVKYTVKEAVDCCVVAMRTICVHWINDSDEIVQALNSTVHEIINLNNE